MPKIAILILAAGASKRMGSPKQLLPWKGTTLLQHCIDQVKKSKCDQAILVLGSDFEKILSKIETNGITVLNHQNWREGLGSSIAFGVTHIQNSAKSVDAVLIALADQPLVDSKYFNSMIANFHLNQKSIVASLYKEGYPGVPAIFDRTYFDELKQLHQDRGAKDILKRYSENLLQLNAEHLVLDLDTKEDYDKLMRSNNNIS